MRPSGTLYLPIRPFLFGVGLIVVMMLCTTASSSAQNFDYRAINLVSGSSGVDVHFFDREQPSIVDIAFACAAKVSQSLPSMSGAFNVKYTATGAGIGSAFVEADATVQSGYEYTGVAYGTSSAAKLKVLARNKNQNPPVDRALMRVLHAASVNVSIDVHIGQVTSTPVLSAVAPDQVTAFANVSAEATTLIITEAGRQTPLARLIAPFGAGTQIVTLLVTGSNANNLSVYALFDQDNDKQQLLLLEESSYTNVRVVHLRPNADESGGGARVDVYLNKSSQSDTKVTDTLKYRRASREYGPLFTDSFQVKFVSTGESPLNSLLTVNRRFSNDTSYVVAYTQFKDLRTTPIILTRSPVEPLPPGLGTTKARFVNATDFYGELTAVVIAGTDEFRFENVSFRNGTEFQNLPVSVPFSIEIYRAGVTDPIYTGTSSTSLVPSSSYLTIFALGNGSKLSVDFLNESQSGLQYLASFDDPATGVPDEPLPGMLALTSVPNPTVDNAMLHLSLDRSGEVTVALYNAMGQTAQTLPAKRYQAGELSIPLSLESLPAGHYVCVVHADGEPVGTTSLLLVR